MVSRDIILQTVKRMYSSGVDDAAVKSTLHDIGLRDEEIASVIAEAKGIAAEPKAVEAQPEAVPISREFHEAIAKKTTEHVGAQIRAAEEETALRETAVHATIAEHAERLEDVSKGVNELRAMAAGESSPLAQRISALEKRIGEQQKDIGEIKAATLALQSLLKNVLSTTRSILLALEQKKR